MKLTLRPKLPLLKYLFNSSSAAKYCANAFGIAFCLVLALSLTQCNIGAHRIIETPKLSVTDPFKNTIVPSQFFSIDANQDNVVEGEKGTVLVFPKGCFKNRKGDIVDKDVKIELSEALNYDDMLVSNLTTTSNGKPLETDGMIYFNATAGGEQLEVNKDNPVHIEIPTKEKKPGMKAWKGTRDANGNMDWSEPKELDNYLTTVDLDQLDFLPKGFAAEVERGMPFKQYKTATKELTDSLFYSLTPINMVYIQERYAQIASNNTDYNEPYYSKLAKVVNGKYIRQSYNQHKDTVQDEAMNIERENDYYHAGVDPSAIKILKTKKFQNSLIATREFSERLQAIYKCCGYPLLDIYVNNLDKNMYELDSMAWVALKDTTQHFGRWYWYDNRYRIGSINQQIFYNFYQQHLTKVKDGGKDATLLKAYYAQQLEKGEQESEKVVEKLRTAAAKKDKVFDKLVDDYEKLLDKREKYRMETYGFTWTQTGWVNIDNGTIPKTWGPQRLEATVENSKDYNQVYTYVVYESIKSLYRLNTDDKQLFYVGSNEDKTMLMPKHGKAVLIAVAYKGDTPALAVKEFDTGAELKFSLQLKPASLKDIKEALKPFEKYKQENKISVDLEYMKKFYKAEQQRQAEMNEIEFIFRLWVITRPCYGEVEMMM